MDSQINPNDCANCGQNIHSNFSFCPSCGENQKMMHNDISQSIGSNNNIYGPGNINASNVNLNQNFTHAHNAPTVEDCKFKRIASKRLFNSKWLTLFQNTNISLFFISSILWIVSIRHKFKMTPTENGHHHFTFVYNIIIFFPPWLYIFISIFFILLFSIILISARKLKSFGIILFLGGFIEIAKNSGMLFSTEISAVCPQCKSNVEFHESHEGILMVCKHYPGHPAHRVTLDFSLLPSLE